MPLTVTPHSTSIQLVARFIRHVARNCSTAVKVSAARIPTEDRCINSFDVASTSIARSTTIVKRIPVPLQFSDSVFRYNPCRTNWNRRTESSSGSQLTRLTGLSISISTPLLPSPIIPRLIVRWQGSIESRRRSAISLGTAATMSPRPAFNRDWAVLRALKDDCSCPLCSPLLERDQNDPRTGDFRNSRRVLPVGGKLEWCNLTKLGRGEKSLGNISKWIELSAFPGFESKCDLFMSNWRYRFE